MMMLLLLFRDYPTLAFENKPSFRSLADRSQKSRSCPVEFLICQIFHTCHYVTGTSRAPLNSYEKLSITSLDSQQPPGFQTGSKIKYVQLNNLHWSQSKLQALFVYLGYIEANLALSEDPIDTTITTINKKENGHHDDTTDIEMDIDASVSSTSTSTSSPVPGHAAKDRVNSKLTMIIINGLLEELLIASSNMIRALTEPIPSATSKPTTTANEGGGQHSESESSQLTLSQILEDYKVERAMMTLGKIKMLEFKPYNDDDCTADSSYGASHK
ncbi:unnamed protein product [Ambrosiozyma monospora]|uniref:Unnamed protein product n=1 Tax=Ambrosiozyma monospora TaxID=43982 RepID=A0A9W6Z204_AMBMO|nr:unnamed protein product [Ambrosiozyma monospora]